MIKALKNFLAYLCIPLSDSLYSKITYFLKHCRMPNLKNPVLFNDKLLYLKLTERNPLYHILVDKYEVRKFISKTVGSKYLIPLVGVFNSFDEINFKILPNKFALKVTNGSQNNLLCLDKEKLAWDDYKKDIDNWLKKDFYLRTREWPYKGLENRIIIEELLESEGGDLVDYKFWCFNGDPRFLQIDSDRFKRHKRDFYSIDFEKKLDYQITYPNSDKQINKPENYSEMLKIVRKLSSGLKFVRVDLYNVSGAIFFGEITFYPDNCNGPMGSIDTEEEIGMLLDL